MLTDCYMFGGHWSQFHKLEAKSVTFIHWTLKWICSVRE